MTQPRRPPPTPPRRGTGRRLGLRVHLLALVLAVLLPALTVGAAGVWLAVGSYDEAFEARLKDTARALALAIDAEIETLSNGLTLLATSEVFDPGTDPDRREARLRRAADVLGAPVGLLDTEGRHLSHTATEPGAPPPPPTNSPEALRRAVEMRSPQVLDLVVGAAARRPIAAVMVPVLREERVTAVIAARLEPERLRNVLAAQGLKGEAVAALLDGRGRFVVRTRGQEEFLGRPAQPWFISASAGRDAGLVTGLGIDDTGLIAAFARLRTAPGWTVWVAEPRAAFARSRAEPLLVLAGAGLPLLVLGTAMAFRLSRRLLRPVAALGAHARAIADGTRAPGALADTPPSPVAEFEVMRRDLARGEAALREGEERLRLAAEANGFGIWDVDLERQEGVGTPRLFEIYGLPTPPDGRVPRSAIVDLIHPEDAAAVRAEHERMARNDGGGPFRMTNRIRRASDGAERWVEVHGRYLEQAGRRRFLAFILDVTDRKAAEERQVLLMREVDHRAKNALAVVQAALRLTPKDDPEAYARAVEGRISALSRAQTLLAQDRWTAVDLHALLGSELAPFGGQRADLEGPRVALPAGVTQPLAMAVHELATNAVKHGALSVPEGRVSVSWRLDPATGILRLRWAEADGPAIAGPPARHGFGSRVLDATVRGQLGGRVALDWRAAGLVCELEVPLRRGPYAAATAADAGTATPAG